MRDVRIFHPGTKYMSDLIEKPNDVIGTEHASSSLPNLYHGSSVVLDSAQIISDPTKVDKPNTAGYIDNNPKTLMGLKKVSLSKFPPAAMIYGALAMADGARKYGPYNWRGNQVTASIYVDAMMRHVLAWFDGEEVAADSGVPHLAHALACLAIIIDAKETGNLIDDRPLPGAASDLISRFTKSSADVIASLPKKD